MYRAFLFMLVFTQILSCTVIQDDEWPVGTGEILLTFDDGPNGKVSHALLDVLKSHGVSATFFYVGRNVEKHPQIVARAVADGHQVAVHSYARRFPPFFDYARLVEDVERTQEAINRAIGEKLDTRLYRPPSGLVTPAVRQLLKRSNIELAHISFYIHDAPIASDKAGALVEKLKKAVLKRNGGAIVLHESRFKSSPRADNTIDKAWLPDAVDTFIVWAKDNNYHFVTYPLTD